jgi:hypothetical protein
LSMHLLTWKRISSLLEGLSSESRVLFFVKLLSNHDFNQMKPIFLKTFLPSPTPPPLKRSLMNYGFKKSLNINWTSMRFWGCFANLFLISYL